MPVLSPKKVQNDVSKKLILSKVSEEQLWQYYIPSLKKFNKLFKSELRRDETPSAIVSNKGGNSLKYHDFGNGDHFDIWNYIMFKYKVTFFEALNIINNDLKIGLPAIKQGLLNIASESNSILYTSRNWTDLDLDYWKQFNITQKILEKYWIKPLEAFWINDFCFKVETTDLTYLMPEINHLGDWKAKIYCPLRDKGKRFPVSNDGGCIYGLKQLPNSGDILFITSSKKDIMTLSSIDYPAIASTSETSRGISKELISYLRTRFNRIFIFNDYDDAGIISSYHLIRDLQLDGMIFTDDVFMKDPSDLVKLKNIEWLKLKIQAFLEKN